MVEGKTLTISIAAYNVEKTLDQLMKSVVAADCMDDLEVLIVNDGSTDKTEQIGRAYQSACPGSVHLISKDNGGHGSTINTGITCATGKYFKAIDGDDWFSPDSLHSIVERLKRIDVDVVVTDFEEHYTDGSVRLRDDCKTLPRDTAISFDDVCDTLPRLLYHEVVFRTALLQEHQIILDEHCFYVDSEYVMYPLPYVRMMAYLPGALYCYRLGDVIQSMSPKSMQKNIAMHEKVNISVAEYYEKHKGSCSKVRQAYILSYISRISSRTYEILLSFPCRGASIARWQQFDEQLRRQSSEVYHATTSRAVRTVRRNVSLYPVAWMWLKLKKKIRGKGL